MNTKQLPYFIAIAENQSLSAAARELDVSQPALSKYLRALEKDVSRPLFFRDKKKMYLTEAGRIYLNAARQILDIQAQIEHSIYSLHHPITTFIRVGASPQRGAETIAMIYSKMMKRYPDVEIIPIEGHSETLLSELKNDRIDLCMTTIGEFTPNLHVFPIHKEEMVIAVPAFHKLAPLGKTGIQEAPQIELKEFKDSPFVQMSSSTTVGQIAEKMIKKVGFRPVTVFQTASIYLACQIIYSGAGVGLIPWHSAVPRKEVVYFRLKEPEYITGCLIAKNGHMLTEEERYFIYLRVKLPDVQENSNIVESCWTNELKQIVMEFEPDYFKKKEISSYEYKNTGVFDCHR